MAWARRLRYLSTGEQRRSHCARAPTKQARDRKDAVRGELRARYAPRLRCRIAVNPSLRQRCENHVADPSISPKDLRPRGAPS